MGHKVKHLNIAVTNRCNLRCFMCDIWKEKPKIDLPVGTVQAVLDARSLHRDLDITLTGGEPFLHKGLEEITEAILSKDSRWLKGISTNGTLTGDVLRVLKRFSKRLPGDFFLHISLDGINCHDDQRGRSKDKILRTIHAVRRSYPSIGIKIKFTITERNHKDILPTFNFCRDNGLDFRPKLVEYAENYTNRRVKRNFLFDGAAKQAIIRDLLEVGRVKQAANDKNAAFVMASINFLMGRNAGVVCQTPLQRTFVMPNGDVFSCLHAPRIGSLNTRKLDVLWSSASAENFRKAIRQKGCPVCVSYHGSTVDN